jgi:hypothetical protein
LVDRLRPFFRVCIYLVEEKECALLCRTRWTACVLTSPRSNTSFRISRFVARPFIT